MSHVSHSRMMRVLRELPDRFTIGQVRAWANGDQWLIVDALEKGSYIRPVFEYRPGSGPVGTAQWEKIK